MNYKILLLDSYEGFRQAAMEACLELKYEPVILPAYSANFDLVTRIKMMYPNDDCPDVIITRGAIAPYLAPFFPNSIFSLASPDDVDFLNAIRKARVLGKHVGLIIRDEYEFVKKADFYKEILGNITITPYRYEKAEEVTNILIAAKKDNIDVTVGGGTLALAASAKIGIPNIFVPTSALSIKKALRNSLVYAKFKEEERRKNLLSNIAMNYIEYGLLIIERNTIKFANSSMKEVLNEDPSRVIGLDFSSVFHNDSSLLLDIKSEKAIFIKDKRFLVKRESNLNFKNFQIFTFQSANVLQEKERVLRDTLRNKVYPIKYHFDDIISESKKMKAVITQAKLYAKSDAAILIIGASGTGKEMLAQSIHCDSRRRGYPFVAINCVAIPHDLFESELFGYEEGAFTSAKKGGKTGLFEIAHNGTLFLDEINSLSYDLQGKLLRAIEEGEFRKVGSEKIIRSDVRIICASNENLSTLTTYKQFRSDLYYRISTLPLLIPPLNKRREDIIPISQSIIQSYCAKYHLNFSGLTSQEKELLTTHTYHGNVRELENILHRFVIEASLAPRDGLLSSCIHCFDDFSERPIELKGKKTTIKMGRLNEMEAELIQATLEAMEYNQSETARILDISRSTLIRKIKEYKLQSKTPQ